MAYDRADHRAGDSPAPHLARFLRRWAVRPDLRIPSLWLEFDLDRPEPPSLPSLCAKLRAPVAPGWLERRLLPALKGGPLTAGQREVVASALAAIPPGGQLLYAFSMLPRGGDLRLEIYGLRPPEMIRYLERLGVPTAGTEIGRAADLFAGVERTHLSFDIGPQADPQDGPPGLRPRLGFAGSYPGAPHREPRWHQLLDRLAEQGLCSPAQRRALLAWPGFDSFWTLPEAWPEGAVDLYCVRYLSHLKIVCQPGQGLESKAYLAFGPYRRSATDIGTLVLAGSA